PSNIDMPKVSREEAQVFLEQLDGWGLDAATSRIFRTLRVKDFREGMHLFNRIAELAEAQGHHPDLHLRNYRHVEIALWTHTVHGLSRNDFVMAAKIDKIVDTLEAQQIGRAWRRGRAADAGGGVALAEERAAGW